MFRPRHAYRSPITNRYRGKAKGCPVFNNLTGIDSDMVEQHDECLECLSKIKNRNDLYRTLAENNKPSNNVIKSLQKLSSSASNNSLKTCLQFLIIRANEKSSTNAKPTTTTNGTNCSNRIDSPVTVDAKEANQLTTSSTTEQTVITRLNHNNINKRQRLHNQQQKQRQRQQQQQKQKHNQLDSPPQDQVSSTQDQVEELNTQLNEHDCQTSPMMFVTTNRRVDIDDDHGYLNQNNDLINSSNEMFNVDDENIQESPTQTITPPPVTTTIKHEDHYEDQTIAQQIQSSPSLNSYASTTTATTQIINKSSPSQTSKILDGDALTTSTTISRNTKTKINSQKHLNNSSRHTTTSSPNSKRRKIHNSSDHDTSSTASWSSSSYASPQSPISTSSVSSRSSTSSSASQSSSSSSCSSSSLSPSPSPSSISSPDIINELRGPRLKLSEEKIRKIKKRPILFDDNYYTFENSFASTPTTSSGCSPGQHSNTTQNSDQSRSSSLLLSTNSNSLVIHMFQAPPKFVNNLKPCNLPTKPKEPTPSNTPPVPMKEMLNCAICGIKDRPPNITKIYGQNGCLLCTRFFATFLKRPQQLYCAQDGDCLMTFDSRCQACWIKICLQKFNIEDEHRKIGQKYSPKLLSSPNVSLITIDTSLSR